jgi:Xaa-Pro aminopeptidase
MKNTSTRITKLWQSLPQKYDAIMIFNPKDRFYLTGFPSSEGILFLCKKIPYLFLDGRYFSLAKRKVKNVYVVLFDKNIKSILQMIKKLHIKTILAEKNLRNNSICRKVQENTHARFYFKDNNMMSLRSIKEKEEIRCITKACEYTDQIFQQFKKELRVGMSEKDMHVLLRKIALEHGILDMAFEPIIAPDAATSYSHYIRMDKGTMLKKNSMILLDFGAKYENYRSDMTRMIFMKKSSNKIQCLYEKLLEI